MNQSPLANLITLYNNPFLIAPLFEVFYRELGVKDHSALLAYLVLPLVLPDFSCFKLARTTSLRTFVSEPKRTYGLAARIAERRRLTNLALQYNVDQEILRFEDPATFVYQKSHSKEVFCSQHMVQAAKKLGGICAPHSIPAIYLQLGIKRL